MSEDNQYVPLQDPIAMVPTTDSYVPLENALDELDHQKSSKSNWKRYSLIILFLMLISSGSFFFLYHKPKYVIEDHLWYKDVIFYEIYVRAYKDSNGDGKGDLQGITQSLPYLSELGVGCIWLLPIMDSPLRDDGYDVRDYKKILDEYGTVEDLSELIQVAHTFDIKVIMDIVPNHCSNESAWFKDAVNVPGSKYRNYFVWSDTKEKYKDVRIIFIDSQESNWYWSEEAGQYYWHRFFEHQPDLNYDYEPLQEEVIGIFDFFLDLDIDGLRVDAVPYLFEREGTTCENLPETHGFLKKLRNLLNIDYPGRSIMLGEANMEVDFVVEYFGNDDELQMNFEFPVMPRVFESLYNETRDNIKWIMDQTPGIPPKSQWVTFLRNHDELTLEKVSEEERQWMWKVYAPDPQMKLNQGIRRRLTPLLDNNKYKILVAHSILFTLIGSPVMYYGDEIGMGDNIWLPDRDGVRTPMQWNNGPNAGFSTCAANDLFEPVITSPEYSPDVVNVEDSRKDKDSLFNSIKHMISTRKKHKSFGRGDFTWFVPVEGDPGRAILSYIRSYEKTDIFILNNLASHSLQVQFVLPDSFRNGFKPVDILTDSVVGDVLPNGRLLVSFEPFQFLWIEMKKDY